MWLCARVDVWFVFRFGCSGTYPMPTEQYMPFYVRLNESRVYICWIQTCTTLPLSLAACPGQFRLLNTTLDFVMTRSLARLQVWPFAAWWMAGWLLRCLYA